MNDFRDAAVTATRREVGITQPEAVFSSRRSACLELPMTSRIGLSGASVALAVSLIGSLLLLVAAIAFAVVAWRNLLDIGPMAWAWAALCFVGAIAAFAVAVTREKPVFRRIPPVSVPGVDAMHREPVGVEPTETYARFKLMPDDLGILYHDAEGGRLLIRSTTHAYCICAPDVIGMYRGEGGVGSGVQVDVRIGTSCVLSIVISGRKDLQHPNDSEGAYDAKAYFLSRLAATLQWTGA